MLTCQQCLYSDYIIIQIHTNKAKNLSDKMMRNIRRTEASARTELSF